MDIIEKHYILPVHVIQSIQSNMAAVNLTLEEINRNIQSIKDQLKEGATPAQLEVIEKELKQNTEKLSNAKN
jgi:hypothetical protein